MHELYSGGVMFMSECVSSTAGSLHLGQKPCPTMPQLGVVVVMIVPVCTIIVHGGFDCFHMNNLAQTRVLCHHRT